MWIGVGNEVVMYDDVCSGEDGLILFLVIINPSTSQGGGGLKSILIYSRRRIDYDDIVDCFGGECTMEKVRVVVG